MWRVLVPQRWRPVTKRSTLEALCGLLKDNEQRRMVFERRGRQRIFSRAAEVLSITEEALMSRLASLIGVPFLPELRAYPGDLPVTDQEFQCAHAAPIQCERGVGLACLDPVGLTGALRRLTEIKHSLFISPHRELERVMKNRRVPPSAPTRSAQEARDLARSLLIAAAKRAWSSQCALLSVIVEEDTIRLTAGEVCSRLDRSLEEALGQVLRERGLSWIDPKGDEFNLSVDFPVDNQKIFAAVSIVAGAYLSKQRTVLVVDDDVQFAKVLARYLQGRGFSVSTYCSPAPVLSSIEIEPQVVLVKGITRTKAFQGVDGDGDHLLSKGIPTLALLSDRSAGARIEALRQGAVAVFRKDDDPELVVGTLSNLCRLVSR